MACEGHSEATELDKFIQEFGEDIPEEWVILCESLILAVTKKDFYLAEQLDGITEMRVYDDKEAKRIIANLYDVKNNMMNKNPRLKTPDYSTWKKLYFVKIIW